MGLTSDWARGVDRVAQCFPNKGPPVSPAAFYLPYLCRREQYEVSRCLTAQQPAHDAGTAADITVTLIATAAVGISQFDTFDPSNDSCRGRGQLAGVLQCTSSIQLSQLYQLRKIKRKKKRENNLSNYQNSSCAALNKDCTLDPCYGAAHGRRCCAGCGWRPRVVSYCSWVASPSPISKGVLHCVCDEAGKQ